MFFIPIISFLSGVDGGYLDTAIQLLFIQREMQVVEIGLSISLMFLLTMFIQLFIQKSVRKHGYKPYLLGSIFIFIFSLFIIIFTDNRLIALICNITQGIAIWIQWTLLQSYVVDRANDGSQYGKLQFVVTIGNCFGAIMFLLFMISDIPYKYEFSILLTIIAFITVFIMFIFKKNVIPAAPKISNQDKRVGYKAILKERVPQLYILYYVISAIQMSLLAILSAILISVNLGMGDVNVAIFNIARFIVGATIMNIAIRRTVNRMTENISLLILNILFIIALFGNQWILLCLLIFNRSVIYSIFAISVDTEVHDLYSDGRSSLLMGLQSSAEYIGYAIGALIAGLLLALNHIYLIAVAFAFMLAVTLVLYFLRKEMRTRGLYYKQRMVTNEDVC